MYKSQFSKADGIDEDHFSQGIHQTLQTDYTLGNLMSYLHQMLINYINKGNSHRYRQDIRC